MSKMCADNFCEKTNMGRSFEKAGFVLLTDVIPDALLEIRYYSTLNFVGERIDSYEAPVAYLTKEAACALKKASDALKKQGYKINLVLILPCRDQTARWSEYDRRCYNSILASADEVIYTAEKYYPGCMQKRNRALVDASSACICYLTSSRPSGTLQTVEYARTKNLATINIAN